MLNVARLTPANQPVPLSLGVEAAERQHLLAAQTTLMRLLHRNLGNRFAEVINNLTPTHVLTLVY
jgi:hypothetical protein